MENKHTRKRIALGEKSAEATSYEATSGRAGSEATSGRAGSEKSTYRKSGYSIVIEELALQASIGVYPHERKKKQPLVISLKLNINAEIPKGRTVRQPIVVENNSFLCYKTLCDEIKEIVATGPVGGPVGGHIELLEDLGEMLAQCCFAHKQVQSLWLSLRKTQAIEGTKAVGVELAWQRK